MTSRAVLLVGNRLHRFATRCVRLVTGGAVELQELVVFGVSGVLRAMRWIEVAQLELSFRVGDGNPRLKVQPVVELDVAGIRCEGAKIGVWALAGFGLGWAEARNTGDRRRQATRAGAMVLDVSMAAQACGISGARDVGRSAAMFAV